MSAPSTPDKDISFLDDLCNVLAFIFLLILMTILPRTIAVVAIAYYKFKVFDRPTMLLGAKERQKNRRDHTALSCVLILLAFAVDLVIFSKLLG